MAQRIFTTGQIAKMCKVAARTVAKWCDTGKLEMYRIPGSLDRRITHESLISFMRDYGMPMSLLGEECHHNILLVGCQTILVSQLVDKSTDPNWKWHQAEDAFDAGVMFITHPMNTIIIDMAIGRGEATSTIQRIHNHPKGRRSLLIALANEDDSAADALSIYGVNVVIRKPVDPDMIISVVHAKVGENNAGIRS